MRKGKEVCIKTRSIATSLSLIGWDTKLKTVKWSLIVSRKAFIYISIYGPPPPPPFPPKKKKIILRIINNNNNFIRLLHNLQKYLK